MVTNRSTPKGCVSMVSDPDAVDAPLFASAAAAAAFALNFSGQSYQRPLTDRMAQPSPSRGKGLYGLDGAAQAGMIRAELATLGLIGEAIITAEMANRTKPCSCRAPCCAGHLTNPEWAAAIGLLSNVAKELKICPNHMNVRSNLLRRFFGVPVEITEIAKLCGVTRDTVYNHNAKLITWLKPLRKKAWSEFDAHLIERGLING